MNWDWITGQWPNGPMKNGICPEDRQKDPANWTHIKTISSGCLKRMHIQHRQIYQRIQENGFDGGITILTDYVRKIRPPKVTPYLKLSFAPGECAQVDWGSFGNVRVGSTSRRLSFFVMVLCHSRMMYVEFTVSQTMEHFLGCHQNAFHFFGCVPQKVMVDNLKSAVLKRTIGNEPVFNPQVHGFCRLLRV
jgi:transposase